jgi:hypothetical protein
VELFLEQSPPQCKEAASPRLLQVLDLQGNSGRGERIRTSGLYVPNVALYQAKLHPDVGEKLLVGLQKITVSPS